jgi:hypothetical protein
LNPKKGLILQFETKHINMKCHLNPEKDSIRITI